MPEGHTIHRIARDHRTLLCEQRVAVSSPQGRFAADAALVDGVVLDDIDAYGKHLFYRWANGLIGHVHLGLFGKFRVSRGGVPPTVRGEVRMRLSSPLATIDLSGPTACTIGTADERDAILARLGPDPLRRNADAQRAIAKLGASRVAIGALLLDQKMLAGVGNVYRAEALFVTGIHPERPGNQCSTEELHALWTTIVAMLRQGVRDNRIITIDRAERDLPTGRRSRRGDTTYVYHREQCLRCSSVIRTADLGGRPCYFCPTCQPR